MADLKDLIQTGDWKAEKHVPVIEGPAKAKKGAWVTINVAVGQELPHPNETKHHIRWIGVYFHPRGEKFPYEVARCEFLVHGESAQGPDTGTVYAAPSASVVFKTDKPGTIIAASYCNIHGLWQNSVEIEIE